MLDRHNKCKPESRTSARLLFFFFKNNTASLFGLLAKIKCSKQHRSRCKHEAKKITARALRPKPAFPFYRRKHGVCPEERWQKEEEKCRDNSSSFPTSDQENPNGTLPRIGIPTLTLGIASSIPSSSAFSGKPNGRSRHRRYATQNVSPLKHELRSTYKYML